MHVATPSIWLVQGLPWWFSAEEFAFQCRGSGFDPWSGRDPTCCGAMKAKLLLLSLCPLEPTAVTKDPACHSEELMCCNWDLTSHINEQRNHLLKKKKKRLLVHLNETKNENNSKATSAIYQTLSTVTRSPFHSGSWRQNRGGDRKASLLFWEAPPQVYHLRPAYLNDSGEKVYMPSIYWLTLGSQSLILHVNCRSSLVLWCLPQKRLRKSDMQQQ